MEAIELKDVLMDDALFELSLTGEIERLPDNPILKSVGDFEGLHVETNFGYLHIFLNRKCSQEQFNLLKSMAEKAEELQAGVLWDATDTKGNEHFGNSFDSLEKSLYPTLETDETAVDSYTFLANE